MTTRAITVTWCPARARPGRSARPCRRSGAGSGAAGRRRCGSRTPSRSWGPPSPRPRQASRPTRSWTPAGGLDVSQCSSGCMRHAPTRPRRAAGSRAGRRRRRRRRRRAAPSTGATHTARARSRTVGAGDHRDQLAAAAEQPVEDVGGDLEQSCADHDEVALDRRRARRRARTGPPSSLPRAAAIVTAPERAWRAAAVIATTSCSKSRPGSCTASAASPCTWASGRDDRDPHPARSPARCAPPPPRQPTESRSFGSTMTSAAPVAVTASRSSPVGGSPPGPPATTVAPASTNRLPRPAPAATATTARPVRRAARRGATCSAKWVTLTRYGRPASMPASIAAPTSSTCTWTFHSPSPPTTTRESPRACERLPQQRRCGRRRHRAGTSPRTPGPSGGRGRRWAAAPESRAVPSR